MEENDQTTEEPGASRPRLPFALFDGAMSGLQTALHTVGGLAAAPFKRSGEPEAPGGAPDDAREDEIPAPLSATGDLTDASPSVLAAALDAKGAAEVEAHASGVGEGGTVIDRMPRADAPTGDRQLAPDEELGPKPFTPQVGP